MLFITYMASGVLDAMYSLGHRGGQTLNESCIATAIVHGTLTKNYLTVSDLAARYSLPSSTVSDYVSRAIANGLVYETVDSNDRRRRILKTSKAGLKNVKAVCGKINEVRKSAAESDMPFGTLYTIK